MSGSIVNALKCEEYDQSNRIAPVTVLAQGNQSGWPPHKRNTRKIGRITSEVEALTKLLQHFVALVQNEMLDFLRVEVLVAGQGVKSPGSSHDDVWALGLVFEELDVLGDWGATEHDGSANVWHVTREAGVLVADLVRKFSGMAQNDHGDLSINRLQLLQGGEHKDCSFSVTGLCLAKHVHSKHSLRNALLLH